MYGVLCLSVASFCIKVQPFDDFVGEDASLLRITGQPPPPVGGPELLKIGQLISQAEFEFSRKLKKVSVMPDITADTVTDLVADKQTSPDRAEDDRLKQRPPTPTVARKKFSPHKRFYF